MLRYGYSDFRFRFDFGEKSRIRFDSTRQLNGVIKFTERTVQAKLLWSDSVVCSCQPLWRRHRRRASASPSHSPSNATAAHPRTVGLVSATHVTRPQRSYCHP